MMSLPDSLHTLLKTRGSIPFVEFMHHALYAPDFGYYTTSGPVLGPQGDFITAPELSPLFGQTFALQCQRIFAQLKQPNLLEFGAGSGRLCVDVLQQLEALNSLPQHYFILEVSGQLRARQKALFEAEIPHLVPRIAWLSQWPDHAFSGVILANEVLDAMPVHRFLQDKNQLFESVVALDENEALIERFEPCADAALKTYIQEHLTLGEGPYYSEVNLLLPAWIKQCSAVLEAGVFFIIDYGFPRAEYYHPDRNQGTLMCHYQHVAHTNPLVHVGQQDITAHVDFTQVAEAAVDAGFEVTGFNNQASFLLAGGLPQLLEKIEDPAARLKAVQAVKQLTQPHEMGELFKVMTLTKGCEWTLQGPFAQDKRGSL